MVTLEEARAEMLKHVEDGVACPCCGRLVKVYKRKLHAEMAVFLIKLVRAHLREKRWYHTRELIRTQTKAATDASYLEHWRLLERCEGREGLYRPKPRGISFVCYGLRVPSHVYLLNNEVQGWAPTSVSVREALGTRFDYDELMRGARRRR